MPDQEQLETDSPGPEGGPDRSRVELALPTVAGRRDCNTRAGLVRAVQLPVLQAGMILSYTADTVR